MRSVVITGFRAASASRAQSCASRTTPRLRRRRIPIWSKIAPLIGRCAGSIYGEAFDRGLRTVITAGCDHELEPRQVAATIRRALTAAHPETCDAPARHPVAEQDPIRALPRRLIVRAMRRCLGLKDNR